MPATLEQVRSRVTRAEDGRDPLLGRFAEELFEKADPAFLEAFDADALVAMARGAFAFLDAQGGEGAAVDVLQPSYRADGWEAPYTVLRLALRDRPFVVDSVRAELDRQGVQLFHLLHPIHRVVRDERGGIAALGEGERHEAFEMYFVERIDEPERREALRAGVERVLRDVVLATDGYPAMRAKAIEARDALLALRDRLAAEGSERAEEFAEYAAFLDWLDDDAFVFLGYREYDLVGAGGAPALRVAPGTGLGILSREEESAYREPVPLSELPANLRERVVGGQPLVVTRTNAEATVHRRARMDYVGVKKLDEDLNVVGERRFVGLFTSKAVSIPADETPILRSKLRGVLDLDDAVPGSHDYKEIVTVFNSMPRNELFWADAEALHREIRTVMALEQERGVKLTVRADPLQRGLALTVIMPRDRFNAVVRRRIQAFLAERLDAEHTDYQLAMGEDQAQVRFHFFFMTRRTQDELDVVRLERDVAELTRSWDDHLRDRLAERHGAGPGRRLAERYLPAIDERYKADAAPGQAVRDIDHLEALGDAVARADLLAPVAGRGPGEAATLRVYHRQGTLVLSDVLPVLENLGLRVLEQVAYPFPTDLGRRGLDVFHVHDLRGRPLDVRRDGERLVRALETLLAGGVDNDRLNRLVLLAGLDLRQVALLRAYQMYYAQLNAVTSRAFVNDALLAHPEVARRLLAYHDARFDPALEGDREAAMDEAEAAFAAALAEVASLPEDRALRGLFDLMRATVRTNYYRGAPVLAFKIASERVESMPEPRPMFEIAVSGHGVEGTHLRGGLVARGGIRWSDRPDDFRTEILGLMKTQMTKNAVIVPLGSKGGFVVKRPPADRDALRAHVEAQYRAYVGALLDLTDDRAGDEIVHPEGMVIHDGPDPYLVVAADKGTATFSDVANEVATSRGFWLGDAFASGGSHGYDHKREGITARGAWVCVARHFRELGVDTRRDPFTVAGIGDMSGDVFGNGMLHSRTMRLQAAFNHLHVFLDPDPDPERAYEERSRLFRLPRSSWADYDASLISEGGGVYERAAKEIRLAPQARAMLGLEREVVSGQELVQAVLRMPVDLLWNGGIGTYVKAASERHADVGDAANDGVRVDASELRARVVGEGGNLGLTQLARIEYAQAGGRVNRDAIDNSGGVDMSDREVNIKILLQPLVERGELAFAQRNRLLEEMTDEVSALVLADSDRQALSLSLAERRAAQDPELFFSLQEYLAERGDLDPAVEFLPDRKAFAERRREGRTYTRPELAILLAYAKMGVYRRLLETDFPADPHLEHLLFDYFPRALGERFPEAVRAHPLRREIVATAFTNLVVDILGSTFVHRIIRDSGATPVEIIRSALVAMELLDTPAFVRSVDRAEGIEASARYDAIDEAIRAVEGVVAWILLGGLAGADMRSFVDAYGAPLAALRDGLPELLPKAQRRALAKRTRALAKRGFDEATAARVAVLDYLPSSIGAIEVARATGLELEEAARRFFAIGERLRLGWLRDRLAARPLEGRWEKIALAGLVMDLRRAQQELTTAYVRAGGDEAPERWLARVPGLLERFDAILERLEAEEGPDLAAATVIVRLLDRTVAGLA